MAGPHTQSRKDLFFTELMAKDPAFLFYPGDYLRDTQCLSEKAQVAYDRIMCEHMRNICEDMINITVSKDKVSFFIKRLNEDEKFEIMNVLKKVGSGFQIEWVALSISKRKIYSNSRRQNKKGKSKNISSTYDYHMENENVNENEIKDWDMIKRNFFNDFRWKEKFCRDKKIMQPDLENRMKEFINDIELKEDYKNLKELKNHFTNRFNKNSNGLTSIEKFDSANAGTSGKRLTTASKW